MLCRAHQVVDVPSLTGGCVLSLLAGVQEKQVLKQVALPQEVYTGSCTQLFDFLAQTLADFIREQQQVGAHAEPNTTALGGSATQP